MKVHTISRIIFVCLTALSTGLGATDLSQIERPGPRQLVWLGGSSVLDWDPPAGAYRIWHYDSSLQGNKDPLPGTPLVSGTWKTIRSGRELISVGHDVVLDWEPLTGNYRLWRYDRTLTGNADPFPGSPIVSGTWKTIRTGHRLLYLDSVGMPDHVLDWEPGSGHYRIWLYDRSVKGTGDPFPGNPITEGTWSSIHAGHELIALENSRVLDWEPQTGHYRVWLFNPAAHGGQDPLTGPHNEGIWKTVQVGHVLVPLIGVHRVLDWAPVTGRSRVWVYDSNAAGATDPLPSPAITDYAWKSIRSSVMPAATASNIKHVVVIVQENHSFDSYFGNYCKAPPYSNPSCTKGSDCCEGPQMYTGGLLTPRLNNDYNGFTDRAHDRKCEIYEMDSGKMNRFVYQSAPGVCGSIYNLGYSWMADIPVYKSYAEKYALADRYFQPVAGASAANDVYVAGARWRFNDNDPAWVVNDFEAVCCLDTAAPNDIQHIGALLWKNGVGYATYAEGYTAGLYQSGDNPFAYFQDPHARDPRDPHWTFIRDVQQLDYDLVAGALPQFSLVKARDAHSEHPGGGKTISDGMAFVSGVVNRILASPHASNTLILFTYDESGGFYDHVSPPAAAVEKINGFDVQVPYGPRVPMLALGHFAKQNYVSHVDMEHSSIVKFIEWNWLNKSTGQLGARDVHVHNIGSLLDPVKAGNPVPD